MNKDGRVNRARMVCLGVIALLSLLIGNLSSPGQVTPEQQAEMALNSARKAYNERNYPFAIARFKEFLSKYGSHKEVPAARYGLALSLLALPEKDYTGAIEQLQPLAGNKDFADHAAALYHLGVAQRGLGVRELAQAAVKPQEANQRRTAASQRFEEAAKQFAAAVTVFTAKVKEPAADAKQLPIELEWACRARCDQAEMQLRTAKAKEAKETVAGFVRDDAWLAKSRYRDLGLYYHGFAGFLLKDNLAAGRSLNRPAVLADPVFGTHSRYLLARVHHLSDEQAEAAIHYETVLTDYAKHKQAAVEALKQPDKFKNDPEEKSRLEALVRDPPPDHVARAAFFGGVLLYEAGKFGDALARFGTFQQQYPGSHLLPDAQLRQGFCQVQLKQFPEAIKALQPLADKEPRLADQALLWIGKAQVGSADPANVQNYEQSLRTALDTFRRAADRANQLAASDPEAKLRRGEILLELADTQQQAKQYKEAGATHEQILNEKLLPQRDEEVLQRQITAVHLAADYARSDQLIARFQQQHPKSSLLPAVLFRHAENAYFQALAFEKGANQPNRAQELARLYDEAGKRYQAVIDKFSEFTHVHVARYGLAMVHYRKEEFEKAQKTLQAIPQDARQGDLALTPYLLADCILRLMPAKTETDDAVAAGKALEEIQSAAELLESFVNAQPNGTQTPDALLKLGLCQQRHAGLLAQPPERAKMLASARTTYERLIQQFPKSEAYPQAIVERAKCLNLMGDPNSAVNELRRFANDAQLKIAPIAPMALLQLATLLRSQNKPGEAADVLAQCRQQHEQKLVSDPTKHEWAALLQYHHGVALREAGKLADARGVFENITRQFPTRPEAADAALRRGQCLKEEGMLKIEPAQKKLGTPNLKPDEIAAVNRSLDEGYNLVRQAVQYFDQQAEQLKQKQPPPESRARLLYEAAWCYRTLAEPEIAAARTKIQQERLKKLQEERAKKNPGAPPVAVTALPEVIITEVPLQPSEQKARAQYQALIAAFPDLPLSYETRFELAELFGERSEHDAAVKLLTQALDKVLDQTPPRAELIEKIRLRLGVSLAAKKDFKAALGQFDAIAQNQKSTLAGQAHYRAGECLMQQGEFAKAAARLAKFRDDGQFQNIPGLTDRALLRLGHALAHSGQWDQSRQAHETLAGRFPNSPWIHEARYGIGWAWQNQKQYDNAANAYSQVTAGTATEIGARAQLQIGLCRLEQKRYPDAVAALLVVPFTYDYPDLSALALCEAARSLSEQKQHEQAERLLKRVIRDHPESKWAAVAKERLEAMRKG